MGNEQQEPTVTSYTPGPWYTERGECNVFAVRTDLGHEGLVCSTGGHYCNEVDCTPENVANANLVMAAPKLLAACKAALDSHHPNPAKTLDHYSNIDVFVRSQLREAIEKATHRKGKDDGK